MVKNRGELGLWGTTEVEGGTWCSLYNIDVMEGGGGGHLEDQALTKGSQGQSSRTGFNPAMNGWTVYRHRLLAHTVFTNGGMVSGCNSIQLWRETCNSGLVSYSV